MNTIDTQRLIEQLAARAAPTRRLPAPRVRTAIWLGFALLNVLLFVFVMSPRADLPRKLSDPAFVVEQLAALATGITAGFAAFASVVPGCDRRALLLPLLPAAVWLGCTGAGCALSWLQWGSAGLTLQPDWGCLPAIAIMGLVPAVVIAVMLRRGAPLMPHRTAALGGLAAAGLGNFCLRLFHAQDASLMVLVWQIGAVLVLTAAAGVAGRWVFGWNALIRARR